MNTINKKSEILFLYESKYSVPNGDPFTGEQRYDDESKKILVSDVRIKRFIRDWIIQNNKELLIWVQNDKSNISEKGKETGASARMKTLKKQYEKESLKASDILKKCIDVRLFGGISTEEKDTCSITGPVQFALLNPSLNNIDLKTHQNTTVFTSKVENDQGSIATTSIVPYAICQIHGWISPFSAKNSNLTDDDISIMFKALWNSINNANTRSKSNQTSLLLLQIIYKEDYEKIYGIDKLIKIEPNNREEDIRELTDFKFDFKKLIELNNSDKIEKIFYKSISEIEEFSGLNKFIKM